MRILHDWETKAVETLIVACNPKKFGSNDILPLSICTKYVTLSATQNSACRAQLIGKQVEVSLQLFDVFERNMVFIFLKGSCEAQLTN